MTTSGKIGLRGVATTESLIDLYVLTRSLGGVSSKVAGEAACTVTVVRPPRRAGSEREA